MAEASDMIKKWFVTIPELSGTFRRCVYIYLPDSYNIEPDRRYPVMYMFDGHNVFYDSDATFGKSWGMENFLQEQKKDLIVVAVACNHEGNGRLEEYSPFDFQDETVGTIKGRGAGYMKWLTKKLKPLIDSRFRTLRDRKHTILCGSSMGGLMALYGACSYSHIFQRVACLSPSLWVDPAQVLQMIAKGNIRQDARIYMDYGSKELSNHAASAGALLSVTHLLMTKQVPITLRIVPGGEHCEASWEKQIPVFMECLGV